VTKKEKEEDLHITTYSRHNSYFKRSVSLKSIGVNALLNYIEVITEDNQIEHLIERLFPGRNPEMILCTGIRGNTAGHKYIILDFVYKGKRIRVRIDGRLFFVDTTFDFSDKLMIEDGLVLVYDRIPEQQKELLFHWLEDEMKPLLEEKASLMKNKKVKRHSIFFNAAKAILTMGVWSISLIWTKVRDFLFGKKKKKEILKGATCVAVETKILFDIAKFDPIYKKRPWFPSALLNILAEKGLSSGGAHLEPEVYLINSKIGDFWNNLPRWRNITGYIGKVLLDPRTSGS